MAVSDGLFPFQKRYVLATTEDDGLIIVDASDPTDPTYVGGYGGYSTAGNPIDVAESGGTLPFQKRYAYILTDSGDSGEPDTLVIYELPSSWWGTPFIILLLTGIIVGVITAVSYRAHHRNAQPDTSMSMTGTKTKAKTAVYSDYIDNRDTIVKDSVLNRPNVNTGGDDKSEKLWEIKALLDKGIINDDEFKQMKKEILGK